MPLPARKAVKRWLRRIGFADGLAIIGGEGLQEAVKQQGDELVSIVIDDFTGRSQADGLGAAIKQFLSIFLFQLADLRVAA